MKEALQRYVAAGLCALPARRAEKRPAIGHWKQYQDRMPTESELSAWIANNPDSICIVCGAVSGNVEAIDFDVGGQSFSAWWKNIPVHLQDRLVVESTPSGGYHVVYRCDAPVCGNLKLAQRKSDGKLLTLIETRGEGGLILCAPTSGYELVQGDFCTLPVLSESDRDLLLQAAWELNEYIPPAFDGPRQKADIIRTREISADISDNCASASHNSHIGGTPSDSSHICDSLPDNAHRPGDDFNNRGDVRGVLQKHGWTLAKPGENEYWRRPGKDSGWSATLKGRVFYVFSANADPFEPNRAYSPLAVYAMLDHAGDFSAAAGALRAAGFGGDASATIDSDVDISAIVPERSEPAPVDPGPVPAELLRVPGFISEVMDYCLATAPYPNVPMSFCGAMAMQSFLAARKVRDRSDNRTNIYLLGLAHSSSGKDWPRKINNRIVHEIGLSSCLGERFASGEGIQDSLFLTPAMLFQTDEIDGILQSINKAKDARHEAVMSTLLTMYSSANSVFPMRRKAGKDQAGAIDQPHLTIFGTAIPNHYYEALSERMLTNGFFARMIILEAGPRGTGQEPSIREIPPRVLETARWWSNYRPGTGNLETWHPVPTIVECTPDAQRLIIETRQQAEEQYSKAESAGDSVGTTVWGRVSEQTRKLALLYAVSENHQSPQISEAAIRWASAFVIHQTHRMLFKASGHVAENPFHAECLKFIRRLRQSPNGQMARNKLMRAMHCKLSDFDQIVGTLLTQGDIVPVEIPTRTKTAKGYRLP